MKTATWTCGFVLAMTLVGGALAQDKLVLGGAGSMISMSTDLAQAFKSGNPGANVEVIGSTMGSTGGIKALASGKVTVALAARALKADEAAGNVLHAVGRAPVVFATHKDVGVTALKESQVCGLFDGSLRSWREVGGPDLKVALFTRNEDDGTKEAVRNSVSCFKNLRESAEAAILIRSSAMVSSLRSQPGALGMTELDAVEDAKGAFRAIALDGVAPSAESVRNGKYRLYKEYAFVTRGEPQGLVQRFLQFVASPAGQKVLTSNGIVPAK